MVWKLLSLSLRAAKGVVMLPFEGPVVWVPNPILDRLERAVKPS